MLRRNKMALKKNKTLITAVVLLVVFGLVIAYVPLLFAPASSPAPVFQESPEEEVLAEPPAADQITPPVTEPETATNTPAATEGETPLPDGFSGLKEESESLDGLLNF